MFNNEKPKGAVKFGLSQTEQVVVRSVSKADK